MKKLILNFFVLTTFVFATSCSSDDDNNDSSVELEGTWKLTAWEVGETFDLNNDGELSTNILDEMDCYDNETIVFGDGVATYMSRSYADIEVEFGEEGSNPVYTVECEDEFENSPAAYVRNGNSVTITETYEEDGEIYEDTLVATISGNTLSFVIPEGFVIFGDDFEVEVEQDLVLVFTKQ
jgi:hypothetical protein